MHIFSTSEINSKIFLLMEGRWRKIRSLFFFKLSLTDYSNVNCYKHLHYDNNDNIKIEIFFAYHSSQLQIKITI